MPAKPGPSERRLHVLVLAHRFPPTGGAGVQRNLQLARHLEEFGCRATVITGPGPVEYRWTPEDPQLGRGSVRAKVVRLPGTEPTPGPWEARLERWARTPTRWRRWWRDGILRAAASVGEVDVVHASVAPYATGASAVALARRLRRPLVLDFEDPWALDEMLVYPSGVHRTLERRRMGRVLRGAATVVMNTPEARLRVLDAFPQLTPDRVLAIPNAFDPLDVPEPPPASPVEGFRIVHPGSLHTEFGRRPRAERRRRRLLGGAVPGVDFLTRSHVFLLGAVERVRRERPELASSIEVVLAGVFTDEDRSVAARHPFVRLRDFVPHAETIALVRSADLLFLPMHDLPPGRRAGLVPHKTYEYLASGRPILAAVPDGDARDLLDAAGSARLCRPADTDAMASAIVAELERKAAGVPAPPPAAEVVERCSCGHLLRELAGLYDGLAAPSAR